MEFTAFVIIIGGLIFNVYFILRVLETCNKVDWIVNNISNKENE